MENPDMKVSSSVRVYKVALDLSNRPELWIRICQQNFKCPYTAQFNFGINGGR
jgi:hypothetical protein